MRNRTRVIAVTAAVTAALAGSTAAAVASTSGTNTGAQPRSIHAKTVSASRNKPGPSGDPAGRLGVSPARLDRALREVKISLSKAGGKATEGQFYATLARLLGLPEARVRQALPAVKRDAAGAAAKRAASRADMRQAENAFTAAVARELHVSMARVSAALRPFLAAGRIDPSSPAFAAAARSLGISTAQLNTALMHAKESLAGGR